MKIVMFARVPGWYSFQQDRLATRLQAEGHEILGIVVEKTPTVAAVREWLHKLGLKVVVQKAVQKVLGRRSAATTGGGGVPRASHPPCRAEVFAIASHNSDECVQIVRRLQPEVIVLRGCGIIKKEVLQVPSIGTINPHYAYLPAYRGMEVTEWSVLHGDPCAVSVHWVAEAVDAGAVIVSRPIDVGRGDTLGGLREKCAAAAADLLSEALKTIESHHARPAFVSPDAGRQYFVMHPRLRRLAERRLASA